MDGQLDIGQAVRPCGRPTGRLSVRSRVFHFAISLFAIAVGLALWIPASIQAGHVRLKNTIRIDGTPELIPRLDKYGKFNGNVPTENVWMIDNGMQLYFVPRRQVDPLDVNRDVQLSKLEQFEIPQRLVSRSKMLQVVGSFKSMTPFDVHGRRTVTVATSGGDLEIVQAVTLIRPDYIKISGVTHQWEFALATTSIPHDELIGMIRQVTDQKSPTDRLAIYRFYIQANLLSRADEELKSIRTDFPELKDKFDELHAKFLELQAQQITVELKHRREAGQHRLAKIAIGKFPIEELSPAALREVRDLSDHYARQHEQIDLAIARMRELQNEILDENQKGALVAYGSVIDEQLNHESLDRLSAFLNLQGDTDLSAEEKLALAYSGWVVGGERALTSLDTALRLWQARYLAIEYVRTENPNERDVILKMLKELEGVGPQTIADLIPYLPPLIETPELTEDEPFWVTASRPEDEIEVQYQVQLPHEYSPHHRYPLIVTLHAGERDPAQELKWWGGTSDEPLQSRRRGYIVIAPDYLGENVREYDYGHKTHHKVLSALNDARKRFHVDSDRVFLAGHGTGGDAAFDIGMSHPHEFAGVIPIGGAFEKYCIFNWENSRYLAWYVITGELDRQLPQRNAAALDNMMKNGFDLIYTEYSGRGYETYYSEIHKLFDWMDAHRRQYAVKEIKDYKILRLSDSRAYWIKANHFPDRLAARLIAPIIWKDGRASGVKPVLLSAKIADGAQDHNTIFISSPGSSNTLWLSPRLVDYSKRLQVRAASRQLYNDFLQPEIGDMLDDLRTRGDREQFCWTKLEL